MDAAGEGAPSIVRIDSVVWVRAVWVVTRMTASLLRLAPSPHMGRQHRESTGRVRLRDASTKANA